MQGFLGSPTEATSGSPLTSKNARGIASNRSGQPLAAGPVAGLQLFATIAKGLRPVETVSQWKVGFWEQFETFQLVSVELARYAISTTP